MRVVQNIDGPDHIDQRVIRVGAEDDWNAYGDHWEVQVPLPYLGVSSYLYEQSLTRLRNAPDLFGPYRGQDGWMDFLNNLNDAGSVRQADLLEQHGFLNAQVLNTQFDVWELLH